MASTPTFITHDPNSDQVFDDSVLPDSSNAMNLVRDEHGIVVLLDIPDEPDYASMSSKEEKKTAKLAFKQQQLAVLRENNARMAQESLNFAQRRNDAVAITMTDTKFAFNEGESESLKMQHMATEINVMKKQLYDSLITINKNVVKDNQDKKTLIMMGQAYTTEQQLKMASFVKRHDTHAALALEQSAPAAPAHTSVLRRSVPILDAQPEDAAEYTPKIVHRTNASATHKYRTSTSAGASASVTQKNAKSYVKVGKLHNILTSYQGQPMKLYQLNELTGILTDAERKRDFIICEACGDMINLVEINKKVLKTYQEGIKTKNPNISFIFPKNHYGCKAGSKTKSRMDAAKTKSMESGFDPDLKPGLNPEEEEDEDEEDALESAT